MTTAIKHLDKMRTSALEGGGKNRIQKQHDKGKLSARERLDILLDKGSFTELDMFVKHRSNDFGMEENRILTDGVITQRYGLDRNEYGDRFILDLTGRAEIYKIDLEIFIDHIFTGVGPGQAKELREQYGYGQKVAAHTEYSRMLAEHGLLGLLSFLILIAVSSYQLTKSCSPDTKFIKILFGLLALLTMSHSAMRLAMPSFIYGFLFSKYTEEI